MPKLKPRTIVPNRDEDTAINLGIAADQHNSELTKEWFGNWPRSGRQKIGTGGSHYRLHPCHTTRHAGPHRAVREVEARRHLPCLRLRKVRASLPRRGPISIQPSLQSAFHSGSTPSGRFSHKSHTCRLHARVLLRTPHGLVASAQTLTPATPLSSAL